MIEASPGSSTIGSIAVPRAPIALAFACVGATNLSQIAGDTLFVAAFSLGDLSKLVGASAVVRVVASVAYAFAAERAGGGHGNPRRVARFDAGLLGAAAALSLGSAVLARSGSRAAILVACLLQLVLPPLLPLIAFNAATATLAARHAKRVLPLVAAAATVGSIGAGATSTLLARTTGVPSILGVAALLALAAIPLVLVLGKGEVEAPPPVTARAEKGFLSTLRATLHDVRDVPSVRVVVLWGALGMMATTFIDYAFKASLKASYDRDGIASFLGVFNVASNAIVLLVQVTVAGRVVSRLGVGRSLVASPASLAAVAGASLALPAVIGSSVLRSWETLVRYGVASSAADVLLVPLARGVRTRAKVVVKGTATPIGALIAGAILSCFGDAGPGRFALLGLVVGTCVLATFALREAPRAYGSALADALARGRAPADLGPQATALFRTELKRLLGDAVRTGSVTDAERTLSLMTERLFGADDVRVALQSSDRDLRRLATHAAARLTGEGRGAALLALVKRDLDPEIEREVLVAARLHGGLADSVRCGADLEATEATSQVDAEHADLWAEATLHEALGAKRERDGGAGPPAQARVDAALKRLRKAAKEADGPKKASALRAIGLLGDKRAEREVLLATGSKDPLVYKEAAIASVELELPGVVTNLVARLVAGPHAAIAARALALVGPRAVRELVQALPVTRGEGAVAPTAVAESRIFSGTVRAARALARLGPEASTEVLPLFGSIGHRARIALARAFSSPRLVLGERARPLLIGALETLVVSGESVGVQLRAHAATDGKAGLLVYELERRLDDTREAIVDLVTQLGDRTTILRAQTAIALGGRHRDDALELVETLLPPSIGPRVTKIFLGEFARDEAPRALDGWLEKCRCFDRRELPFSDPMASVIDRVLLLRDVTLFTGLSGEELFPVAEIAAMEEIADGKEIVRQGDPSDDLFVLAEGALRVVKDGVEVGRILAGQAFGELGVLDGEARAASVFADGPARLVRIPRVELEALLDESPELARGIIKTLLGYVRRAGRPSLANPEPVRTPTRTEE